MNYNIDHHFNVDVAIKYGIDEAIVFNHMLFWITHNMANETNYHDKDYWTYNSSNALVTIFPYWSRKKINRIINNMCDEGLLRKGNFNKSTYDRTLWYALGENGKSIVQNSPIHWTKLTNGSSKNDQPIPYNDSDNKTYIKESIKEKSSHYGEYNHVLLTDEQYNSLLYKYGDTLDDHIKILDEYIETSGKKYKNHSLVIQKWVHERFLKEQENNKGLPSWYSNTKQTKADDELLNKALELQKNLGGN